MQPIEINSSHWASQIRIRLPVTYHMTPLHHPESSETGRQERERQELERQEGRERLRQMWEELEAEAEVHP